MKYAEMPRMNRETNRSMSRSSSLTFSPLYRQIKELMIKGLEAGEWGPGDAIPSEAELAVRFNVSQGTVRKAIDEMAAENLLLRRQGKGTFVATHSDPRSFFRFLRLMPDDGRPAHYQSEPLACRHDEASPEAAALLHIQPGDPVVLIERLLCWEGKPVVLDEICLVGEFFSGLTFERLRTYERSLYSLFETGFGVRMVRAEERLRAIPAESHPAGRLAIQPGDPLLLVERVAYTYGNRPVEWRRGYYCTEHHHYMNELS